MAWNGKWRSLDLMGDGGGRGGKRGGGAGSRGCHHGLKEGVLHGILDSVGCRFGAIRREIGQNYEHRLRLISDVFTFAWLDTL